MTIHNIIYQKTFNLGMYQSEKIGVEISISEGEDAKEGLRTAKALVEEYHRESDSGDYRGTYTRTIESTPEQEDAIKAEYEEIERKLLAFEFMEDAAEYLSTTSFKMYIPAKAIVNSKPSKIK